MTNEKATAVIEAAKKWRAARNKACTETGDERWIVLGFAERDLSDAVKELEPRK